ncbi:TPA: helix-turn-helix transcriptional regulator [Pseudomonas aeruginosa]
MDIMDDRLIKATEVCQLIGRGKTTLYNLIRSGAFPPPKKNGPTRQAGVYFSERQVLAWIADHRGNSLPTDGLRLSPKPNEIQQEVLYVADVARFFGKPESSIRAAMRTSAEWLPPSFKLGSEYVWLREDMLPFLRALRDRSKAVSD